MRGQKINEIEVMRTFAFASVALQHVLGVYAGRPGITLRDNIIIGVLFGLAKFAVPMFIFLSGMVLFRNYYNKLDYPKFIIKRSLKILVPFFVWSLIYYVWYFRPSDFYKLYRVKDFLIKTLTGSAAYHLWYVFMLFQILILLPFIFMLFGWARKLCKTKITFFLAFLVFSGVYLLLLVSYLKWYDIPVVRNLFVKNAGKNSVFYLYYFVCGGLAALYYDRFTAFVRKYAALFVFGFAGFFVYVEYILFSKGYANNKVNFNFMGSMNIRFYFFTCFSILLLYVISLEISKRFPKLTEKFQFTGKHSFEAYLAHALVITFANLFLLKSAPSLNPKLYYLLLYIMTLVGAMLTAYLIDRVKVIYKAVVKRMTANKISNKGTQFPL